MSSGAVFVRAGNVAAKVLARAVGALPRFLVGRWPSMVCIAVVFFLLYWRCLGWGWLGFDDSLLLRRNPHLGQGFSSFLWGWTDTAYGRRWTPVLWSVANLVGKPTALKFHGLVFILGIAL